MTVNLKDLSDRIAALPEPYRSRAKDNCRDAFRDLATWPQYCVRIVEDLEESVVAHEEDAGEETRDVPGRRG